MIETTSCRQPIYTIPPALYRPQMHGTPFNIQSAPYHARADANKGCGLIVPLLAPSAHAELGQLMPALG